MLIYFIALTIFYATFIGYGLFALGKTLKWNTSEDRYEFAKVIAQENNISISRANTFINVLLTIPTLSSFFFLLWTTKHFFLIS